MKKCRFSCFISVNCRIGSLEMFMIAAVVEAIVNCRIGSLENSGGKLIDFKKVNCRIGSLEILAASSNLMAAC